jgi:hypothetical protein
MTFKETEHSTTITNKEEHKMYSFFEMLSYKRPEGSRSQEKFCNRFLRPVFGAPDPAGNYIKIIGDKPRVAFMSHHDTVHKKNGKQKVFVEGNWVFSNGDCLGADCTTGVYIMLEMISMNIPGVYVVHAAEEIGCRGSSFIVEDYLERKEPHWIDHVDFAISFDRFGTKSIITHQMGYRTASESFSKSFAEELNMGHTSDDSGSYTDSNEYADVISECTNLSVGYYDQHTSRESQDLDYLDGLIEALGKVKWENLVAARDPDAIDLMPRWPSREEEVYADSDLEELIMDHPKAVASFLEDMGCDVHDLESYIWGTSSDRRYN